MEGTYPSLREFNNSQEEIDPVLRNMDANMLQRLTNERDKSDQRSRELEGSQGLALMEDNLIKALRALMTPKQLCPTGANVHALESKTNPGEHDTDKLTKLREVLIKKSRV